tara:strand:- start:1041 stop:1487 length:447 start_codon:yes stop_codon:yes gene_type:complete
MKLLSNVALIIVAMSVAYGSRAQDQEPSVEWVNTSDVLFKRVEIERQNDRYVLSGKIKRRIYNSHVWPGHIDYIAVGSNGKVVAKGAVTYTPSLLLRRWKFGSSFSVLLPEAVSEDALVRVTFHKDQGSQRKYSAPAYHDANVLVGED